MDRFESAALDRHITGNYGEDSSVAIGDVGTTVNDLLRELQTLKGDGRGDEVLFIDPPSTRGMPATLYAGEDENSPEVCELDVN